MKLSCRALVMALIIVGFTPSMVRSDELPSSTDKEKEFKKKVEAATEFVPAKSPEDFMARLQEVIHLHPTVTTFVDDSRESIYAGRGE